MLLIEIDVPNPDHALSRGIYCTVFLIVPSEAIVFNRDGLSVAVVENVIARIRAVNGARLRHDRRGERRRGGIEQAAARNRTLSSPASYRQMARLRNSGVVGSKL